MRLARGDVSLRYAHLARNPGGPLDPGIGSDVVEDRGHKRSNGRIAQKSRPASLDRDASVRGTLRLTTGMRLASSPSDCFVNINSAADADAVPDALERCENFLALLARLSSAFDVDYIPGP